MRKLFCILILALTSTLAYAQRPDQIELPCPPGSSPTWMGQSYNQATGKYRQWQCVKQNGTVTQAITDSGNGGQVFNVKAYGATGDWTTDDTAAIQAAVNAAAVVGGEVFFPCGTYRTTLGIAVSSSVSFVGEGESCAIVRLTGGASSSLMTISGGTVSFRNITLDANVNAAGYDGIDFTSGGSVSFSHATVENAANYGFYAYPKGASNVLVDQSSFTGSGTIDFAITVSGSYTASHVTLSHSTFGDQSAPSTLTAGAHQAIAIETGTGGTLTDIIISANQIYYPLLASQESDGIVISTGGSSSTISNVTISSNNIKNGSGSAYDGSCLEVWGANNVTISNNIFGDNKTAIASQAGATSPIYGIISGNVINQPSSNSASISLGLGADYLVQGNRISAATEAIQVTSSHTTVVGNSFSSSGTQNVYLKCLQATACTDDTITSNDISSSGNANGITIGGGPADFSDLSVSNNRIDTGTGGWAFYSSNANPVGVVYDNTILTTTHHYTLTSGLTLRALESAAPSGACNTGSQWINTAGGASTTLYICEAGTWVAK